MSGTRASRVILAALVVLALLPATARATYDIGYDSLVWPNGNELVFGSTGAQIGLLNDIGLAYLAPDGTVLDRRISSWVPGNTTETIYGGDIAPDGNAWLGANANGNYTFIEVAPGPPMELDGAPCPGGAITLDLAENASIYEIAILGGKLYGIGAIGDDILLVRLDIATCTIDFATRIDPAEVDGDPAQGYTFDLTGDSVVIGGYMGHLAILMKTDLAGDVDETFGDGDGVEVIDPDAFGVGNNAFYVIKVEGSSIYGVGSASALQPGTFGRLSFIGRYELADGDFVDERTIDLVPNADEGFEALAFLGGDGFAAGYADLAAPRAALARFNLDDLEGDPACGGGGHVLFNLAGMSLFKGLETNGSLFAIGTVDNDAESFDYLKAKLTESCTIDPNFVGGANGNRFGFAGAPPLGVRPPGEPDGQTPGLTFANLALGDLLGRIRAARVNLRTGRIGPLVLTGAETDPAGNDDTYRFDMRAIFRPRRAVESQRRRRARRVRIGRGRFSVAEGAQRRAFLRMTRKGKRAVRRARGRRLRIQLQVSVRNEAGERISFKRGARLRVRRPTRR